MPLAREAPLCSVCGKFKCQARGFRPSAGMTRYRNRCKRCRKGGLQPTTTYKNVLSNSPLLTKEYLEAAWKISVVKPNTAPVTPFNERYTGMRPKPVTDRCGKKSYQKKDAVTAMNMRKRSGAEYLRIYHCPRCNWWHLTHKDNYKGKNY